MQLNTGQEEVYVCELILHPSMRLLISEALLQILNFTKSSSNIL